MNCECNNNSNRVEPRIKHVYGNVLRMAIPLTLRTLVKDGDEMIVNDTDFIPSSDHLVRVVFSKGKTNYPVIATMDGNVAIIEDKGKIPVGTYDISVECYDDLGNPYRFKQNAVLYVTDTTSEAGIDEEIEYEAQTWYLNAAVFLATTEIGDIGNVIDTKLEDVFGNAVYDANAKEIRFYNKDNSRVLATIDSRPFIVDGTVADVYIDVSRQVLVVVLNEDAGGRRFSVPLYLVFNSYYKKDEVDSLVSRTVEGVRFDFSQELPLVVPVTKNGSSISSSIDYGAIENAIREDRRLVVACVNNAKYYQLLAYNGIEVAFSRVVALDGYQELLIVNESNVWSMEDVDLGTGGGGGGYEPPVGGIPKSDLAQSVQDTLDDVDNKVDKESGKSLMTDAERTKLADIAAGAEVNVQPNWTQTDTSADDYIKNKPTIPDTSILATKTELNAKQDKINDLATIRINSGKGVADMSSNADGTVVYTLANGDTYTIDLNHEHPQYVESDDLADVATSGSYNDLTDKPVIPEGADLSGYYTKTEIDNKGFITTETDPTVPSWAKQSSKPTYTAQEVGALPASTTIPTKVSDLTNDSGFITSYTETDPTVPAWAKSATKPSYTASEVGAVPTTRKVNGKALSADISLGAGDVGALPSNTHIPADQVQSNWNETNTSSKAYIQNKPTIPAAQVNADWNATSGVSRILNKPTIPTVPTNVSSFTNDAGYLTQHQSLANYYTKSEIDTKIGNIETLLASI